MKIDLDTAIRIGASVGMSDVEECIENILLRPYMFSKIDNLVEHENVLLKEYEERYGKVYDSANSTPIEIRIKPHEDEFTLNDILDFFYDIINYEVTIEYKDGKVFVTDIQEIGTKLKSDWTKEWFDSVESIKLVKGK